MSEPLDRGFAIKTDKGYFRRLDARNINWDEEEPTHCDAFPTSSEANKIIKEWGLQALNPVLVPVVYFDGVGYEEGHFDSESYEDWSELEAVLDEVINHKL